jgi:hypothetical protein
MDPAVIAAIVAAVAAFTGVPLAGFFAHRSTMAAARQMQFGEVLKKRIEVYPKLWRIHITYETNWVLDQKLKTGAWAQDYLNELNTLNLDAGAFFSEPLYQKFNALRTELVEAARNTRPDQQVADECVNSIRSIVYGADGPGMATHEKNDLGSYQSPVISRKT